jgi:hypothetical protein
MKDVSLNIFFSNRMQGAHQSDPANTSNTGLWVMDEILNASSASVCIWADAVAVATISTHESKISRKGYMVKIINLEQN